VSRRIQRARGSGLDPKDERHLRRIVGLADVDVGFAFLSRHCAKGYASESASAVLVHARQVLRLPRIVAITSPENWGSIAVLEKIGLRFEGMIRLAEHGPELKLFGSA